MSKTNWSAILIKEAANNDTFSVVPDWMGSCDRLSSLATIGEISYQTQAAPLWKIRLKFFVEEEKIASRLWKTIDSLLQSMREFDDEIAKGECIGWSEYDLIVDVESTDMMGFIKHLPTYYEILKCREGNGDLNG